MKKDNVILNIVIHLINILNNRFIQPSHVHYIICVAAYCMMHLDMIMTAIQPVGDCNIEILQLQRS